MTNPYEPPQSFNAPLPLSEVQFEPLPPVASEVLSEQVPMRTLAEFAGKMVLTGRISLAVFVAFIVLVGMTWLFYQPGQNPIWVTIVMLNCVAVASVLMVWRMFETNAACNSFKFKLSDPAQQLIVSRHVGTALGEAYSLVLYLPLAFEVLHNGSILFLVLPMTTMIGMLLLQVFFHAPLIQLLRSFLPQMEGVPTAQELRMFLWLGSSLAILFLVVVVAQLFWGGTPWGWLILSQASLVICLLPIGRAYRQLAREFDKLWP